MPWTQLGNLIPWVQHNVLRATLICFKHISFIPSSLWCGLNAPFCPAVHHNNSHSLKFIHSFFFFIFFSSWYSLSINILQWFIITSLQFISYQSLLMSSDYNLCKNSHVKVKIYTTLIDPWVSHRYVAVPWHQETLTSVRHWTVWQSLCTANTIIFQHLTVRTTQLWG